MVIFHKITWKEFEKIIQTLKDYEKIIQTLKDYKPGAIEVNHKDSSWFDNILTHSSKVKKQHYNIEVGNLSKEDFSRITVIVDMWNVIKNPGAENRISYDSECDVISSKLQRAYFSTFNEHVFPND